MGATVTRRQALGMMSSFAITNSAAGATAASRMATGADAKSPVDAPAAPPGRWQELAEHLAILELAAIKERRLNWGQMHYTNLYRWGPDVLLVFGVGPRLEVAGDAARLVAFMGEPLGMHITPCGRSFAYFVQATASDGIVDDMLPPEWKLAGWSPQVRALAEHYACGDGSQPC